jgi:hypothetical protein
MLNLVGESGFHNVPMSLLANRSGAGGDVIFYYRCYAISSSLWCSEK